MSETKEIFVRVDRCVGCHTCEIACAVEHSAGKSLYAAMAETPAPRQRLYVEAAEGLNVPLLCRHCEDAPCVHACRTQALIQDDLTRLVTQDVYQCIGCWMCTMVCPYGVIGRVREYRVAVKCDRCPDRDTPACVDACPTKALVYAEEESFAAMVRGDAASRVADSFSTGKAVHQES